MNKVLLLLISLLSFLQINAQFGPLEPLTYPTEDPQTILFEDIDGDGDNDVIVGSKGKAGWFENLGGGVLDKYHLISDQVVGNTLALVDIDFDTDIDVVAVTGSFGEYITVSLNMGGGVFAPIMGYPSILQPTMPDDIRKVLAEDVDGDGDIDFITASWGDGTIAWNENLGGLSYAMMQHINPSAITAKSVFAADLSGDSIKDVVYSYLNFIYWQENMGTGVFGVKQQLGGFNLDLRSAHAADIDNDGDQDVMALAYSHDRLFWFENLGAGNFSPENYLPNVDGPNFLTTADVDGDGDLDILYTASATDELGYFENLGGGVIDTVKTTISTNLSGAVTVGAEDIDLDGDIDLFVANLYNEDVIRFNNLGGGVFIEDEDITTQGGKDIELFDMDLDGDLDILYGGDEVMWYENIGGGQFAFEDNLVTQYASEGVAASDFDNDGDMDVVSLYNAGWSVQYYENLGAGNFAGFVTLSFGFQMPKSITVSDTDNDGDEDILAVGFDGDILGWIENLGGGSFANMTTLNSFLDGVSYVSAYDIDGDGFEEAFTACKNSNSIYIHGNNGGVLNSGVLLTNQAAKTTFVEVFDMDNDGDGDIIFNNETIAGGYYSLMLKENLGGIFGPDQNISPALIGTSFQGIAIADMDNDGLLDLVESSGRYMIMNLGGGLFSSRININQTSVFGNDLVLGDLDLDSDMDIIYSHSGDKMIYYRQYGLYDDLGIQGKLYFDENQNGILDSSEKGLNEMSVLSSPQSDFSFTYPSGIYFMNFSDTAGNYQLFPKPIKYWGITSDSLTYNVRIDSNSTLRDSLNFGMFPDTIVDEVETNLFYSPGRCDRISVYSVSVKNTGTTFPSGSMHLELDDSVTFISSTIIPDSINGQHYYWHYDSLFYFTYEQIGVTVLYPDFNSIGDTLRSNLTTELFDSLGNVKVTYFDSIGPILTCAYDPNDKLATPTGIDSIGEISMTTKFIEYTIRFQNTGNDTATNVVIEDYLDVNLDWQSLTIIGKSHDTLGVSVSQKGGVSFEFNNIMLPDSGADYSGSQGYVAYRIYLKNNLPIGTVIQNKAFIYFDKNPAVITNNKIHTLACIDNAQVQLNVFLNDTVCVNDGIVQLPIASPVGGVYSGQGVVGNDFDPQIAGQGSYYIYYTFTDSNSCVSLDSTLITVESCVGIWEFYDYLGVVIFPNPNGGEFKIIRPRGLDKDISIKVFDSSSKLILEERMNKNDGILEIDISKNSNGIYYVHLIIGSESVIKQILKQ